MAWSNEQRKMLFATARRHNTNPEQIKLLLRQLPAAMYDADGQKSTDPSTRSSRLTNPDFDWIMATLERIKGGKLGRWEHGHWKAKLEGLGSSQRYRFGISEHDLWLLQNKADWDHSSLARFIHARVKADASLDELSTGELKNLYRALEGLKKWTMKQRPQSEGGSLYDHAV